MQRPPRIRPRSQPTGSFVKPALFASRVREECRLGAPAGVAGIGGRIGTGHHEGAVLPVAKSSAVVNENSRLLQRATTGLVLPGASTRIAWGLATRCTDHPRVCPGCSKRSRCKAERGGPSEAYWKYAAASARAFQRRRWAFFSSLVDRRLRPPHAPRPLPRLELAHQGNPLVLVFAHPAQKPGSTCYLMGT
jgi:hypothetical protein